MGRLQGHEGHTGKRGREAVNTRIQPASGRERAIIEYLAALDAQLIAHQDTLRERLKLIPNGWRQWRLLTVTVNNLLVAIYDTLPAKTLLHMQRLCTHGEVLVRLKPASRTPEQVVSSEDDLREIINAAMAAECAVCLKDERQIKGCKLRRALMNIVPPDEFAPHGCEYRNVALQNDYRDYI